MKLKKECPTKWLFCKVSIENFESLTAWLVKVIWLEVIEGQLHNHGIAFYTITCIQLQQGEQVIKGQSLDILIERGQALVSIDHNIKSSGIQKGPKKK